MNLFGIETVGSPALWLGFLGLIAAMLALDLGVFHRQAHQVTLKEAAIWSGVWIGLAALFGLAVHALFGPERALEYATGYLIEKALAVDNIFVFVMIFSAFAVPAAWQHRVLFWGVVGALLLRAVFIFAGGALLARFHWAIYLFGALLVAMGAKLLVQRSAEPADPAQNPLVRLVRRLVPMTDRYHGKHFFVREGGHTGRWLATPLFLALVAIEASDVIFAVDSIPAIFAVTTDPFIVFTSNIFAILGLRSLYFLLAGIVDRFRHLKLGLALILVFVGAKMLLVDLYKIPIAVSLGVIAALITGAVVASLLDDRRRRLATPPGHRRHGPAPGDASIPGSAPH
jgi:tellurite resistance protein TerC